MTELSLLSAIRQLTDLRTELLLYKEAERQRDTTSQSSSAPVEALEEAEQAIRFAALIWLMDVAQRITGMAQQVLGDVAESLNTDDIARKLMADLINPEDTDRLPDIASSTNIEALFLENIERASQSLSTTTAATTLQAVPHMLQQLSASTHHFTDYLDAPEECIAALIGQGQTITISEHTPKAH